MTGLPAPHPSRRRALGLAGAAALTPLLPRPVAGRPAGAKDTVAVMATRLPAGTRVLDSLRTRRAAPGFLSQKILRNRAGLLVIEEWRDLSPGTSGGYRRLDI